MLDPATRASRAPRGEALAADVAVCGEDALWMAGAAHYDAIVFRRDAQGHRRHRDLSTVASRRSNGKNGSDAQIYNFYVDPRMKA